ncbi:MAG: FAD-binding protein [Bacteroidales bacterium]|nr:FAD-binding protein [Bacteroidales bacterium]
MMKFDVVVIGGGLAGMTAATELQRSGLRCAVVAAGLSLHDAPRRDFKAAGGTLLAGDIVVSGQIEGGRLVSVRTEKLGEVLLEADWFVLATGKYFSQGIVADMDKVYEPVFGLDVEYDEDRSGWFDPSFAAPQRFLEFGVKTIDGCALKDGSPISNLLPAGEVLAGLSSAQGDATAAIRQSALDAVAIIRRK